MTIAATGPLRATAIRTEYGGSNPMRLGNYRRGHASLWVRANGSGNIAVNHSAAVTGTTVPLRMSKFRGQGKGWTYTNTTVRTANATTQHYHCHAEFGTDWLGANGTNWPMFYINNNGIYSTSTSYYALVIYGRQNNGPFTFTNNSEIQGAGGAANSGAGQHAVYIYNSENAVYANRPIIVNNYAIRGGGGGGGKGGTGGTGGRGYYDTAYTAWEPSETGEYFTENSYGLRAQRSGTGSQSFPYSWRYEWFWGGYLGGSTANNTGSIPNPPASAGFSGITYYRASTQIASTGRYWYGIRRSYPSTYRTITAGGGGGAGGNGGRGIGYNSANQGGNTGAGGAAGGTNAGAGGQGGTGGTGGSWGAVGNTGNQGAGGGYGNYDGWGPAGALGTTGGAAGYSIYAATKWGLVNNNTLNGPTGGGVANS